MNDVDGFDTRAEADLEAYFGGDLLGDMGLRSRTGSILDAAHATSVSDYAKWAVDEYGFRLEVVPCHASSSGAREESTTLSDAQLFAAGRYRLIDRALLLMQADDARVLRGFYEPMDPFPAAQLTEIGEFRGVVAYLIGYEQARDLVAATRRHADPEATKADRDTARERKARSKRELSALTSAARAAVRRAQAAYVVASREARIAAKESRLALLKGSIAEVERMGRGADLFALAEVA